jgi:hypothetical protein
MHGGGHVGGGHVGGGQVPAGHAPGGHGLAAFRGLITSTITGLLIPRAPASPA